MTVSMHAASVPVFKQMLGGLADVLAKAEAHAAQRKIDPAALLFGVVSRLTRQKGMDLLIGALPQLVQPLVLAVQLPKQPSDPKA